LLTERLPAQSLRAVGHAVNVVAAWPFQNSKHTKKAASIERPFPSLGVQPFLLVRKGAPRGFHSQEGKLGLLVFGSVS
jgi:hypothetical protein